MTEGFITIGQYIKEKGESIPAYRSNKGVVITVIILVAIVLIGSFFVK